MGEAQVSEWDVSCHHSSLQKELSSIQWPFISGGTPSAAVWEASSKSFRDTILLMFQLEGHTYPLPHTPHAARDTH